MTAEATSFTFYHYSGDKNIPGRNKFFSGNEYIDQFTKSNLKQHAAAPGNGVTIVTNSDGELAGYMTLFAHSIALKSLASSEQNVGKTPSIPVIKLGMLGVDKAHQGQGIGKKLLRRALLKTKEVGQSIGVAGLYLDAAPEAVEFYKKLGFICLDSPRKNANTPMFIHVNCIP